MYRYFTARLFFLLLIAALFFSGILIVNAGCGAKGCPIPPIPRRPIIWCIKAPCNPPPKH